MSKRVFIVHGWDGKPEHGWYPWLRDKLKENNFEAFLPEMPNTEAPKIEEWIPFLDNLAKNLNENTHFVGHSVGCQAILRFLETKNNVQVGKIILVAPWMELDEKTIEEEGEEVKEIAKPWMETPINFEKIKKMSDNFVAIFSNNDPYVKLSNKDLFKEKLNAKIVIKENEGHFTEDDNCKELDEVLNELKNF